MIYKTLILIFCGLFTFSAIATASDNVALQTYKTELHSLVFNATLDHLDNKIAKVIQGKISISLKDVEKDPILVKKLLYQAVIYRHFKIIKMLLPIYQKYQQQDKILILFAEGALAESQQNYSQAIAKFRQLLAINPKMNPARIALAIALFNDKQLSSAKQQFEKVKSDENLPIAVAKMVEQYLRLIDDNSAWQISFSANYEQDNNVNDASSDRNIEQTGFVKSDSMLPQSAHGIAYSLILAKEKNIKDSHYFFFETNLFGKFYWDNRDYNDTYNRSYLGYVNKNSKQSVRLLSLYERRWIGNKRYQQGTGIRAEYNRWLSINWQISSALEYVKQRYNDYDYLNGANKLFSTTLFWIRNPQQTFHIGFNLEQENTRIKQYSNNSYTLRFGWGQEWGKGISSHMNFSISKRQYQDQFKLANRFPLGKNRRDHIYHTYFALWKRDWHLFGITPKLQLVWKKQQSNFPSFYSYQEKQFNIVFEKNF